jgi:asparagine synthase (glutamine-hydrolysing)
MDTGYLGGTLLPDTSRRYSSPVDGVWRWNGPAADLFLSARGGCARVFTWDGLLLLIRGYARPRGSSSPLDLERVARGIHAEYVEHGTLAVDALDGSFTIALLDGPAGRVVLYRNLVGAGATYYHATPGGLLFSNNLADLVETAGSAPAPNRDVLPTFFLYRSVPGRDTLFDGFHRLLPGEQITRDARGLTRVQRHTFATLRGQPVAEAEAIDALESTMADVVRDCAAHRPATVNLLSGGVDSSYLQVVWNRVGPPCEAPPSASICVDHPRTWQDTDYAITMAEALGTRHTLVSADNAYATYLTDLLAATGEPPNHVQSAYFGHLARETTELGYTAGLCGEGADSLFGLGLAGHLTIATALRSFLPFRPLRHLGAAAASLAGREELATAIRLADGVSDYSDPRHPLNLVAAFTDRDAVATCFGAGAVAEAEARRRSMVDLVAPGGSPQDCLHATAYLGEAAESASLWTTLFNRAGSDLLCPFLDSRVLQLALNLPPVVRYRFRRPKDLLKRALARSVPAPLANRAKLGFGQPVFEWLSPGGQLRPLVERMAAHDFVDAGVLERSLANPNWFLCSLLCYDLWRKLFIDRSLPRPLWAEKPVATPLVR